MSTELGGIRIPGKKMRVSQTYLAIDVQRFLSLEDFEARMDRLIQMIKSAAPARDYDEVLIAGEPETRMEDKRSREGIPVAQGNWRALVDITARLGVEQPSQRTTR